jgi:hypothetical protein
MSLEGSTENNQDAYTYASVCTRDEIYGGYHSGYSSGWVSEYLSQASLNV